jgi:hypothetical protein
MRVVGVNDSGHVIGQDHHRARLSDHDIWLIHDLRREGLTYQEIADKFEVSKALVADICKGRRRGQTVTGQRSLKPAAFRYRAASADEFGALLA